MQFLIEVMANRVRRRQRNIDGKAQTFSTWTTKRGGVALGRPKALTKGQMTEVREQLEQGHAVAAVAREFSVSRATVIRARDAA